MRRLRAVDQRLGNRILGLPTHQGWWDAERLQWLLEDLLEDRLWDRLEGQCRIRTWGQLARWLEDRLQWQLQDPVEEDLCDE